MYLRACVNPIPPHLPHFPVTKQQDDDDVAVLGGGGERARAARVKARAAGQVRTLLGEVEGDGLADAGAGAGAEPAKGCVRMYVRRLFGGGMGGRLFILCTCACMGMCMCTQAWD